MLYYTGYGTRYGGSPVCVLTSWVLSETKFQRMVLVLGSWSGSVLYEALSTTIWPLITSILVWGIWIWAHMPGWRKEEGKTKGNCQCGPENLSLFHPYWWRAESFTRKADTAVNRFEFHIYIITHFAETVKKTRHFICHVKMKCGDMP